MELITIDDLRRGCAAFGQHESRDAMYRVAIRLVESSWGRQSCGDLADALGVLLLTWNNAFYRYGSFDFDALEAVISSNWETLEALRDRDILSYSVLDDAPTVAALFSRFLNALKVVQENGPRVKRSPVAAAKALHLLARRFLPLWDSEIMKVYGCYSQNAESAPDRYCTFMEINRRMGEALSVGAGTKADAVYAIETELASGRYPRSLLKLIDEFNYAKYTKGWV